MSRPRRTRLIKQFEISLSVQQQKDSKNWRSDSIHAEIRGCISDLKYLIQLIKRDQAYGTK